MPTDAAPLAGRLRGQPKPPVKGLGHSASTCFFPILEDQDQVPAGQRDPLVLQLDTFGKTIGQIPVLHGPRLHGL